MICLCSYHRHNDADGGAAGGCFRNKRGTTSRHTARSDHTEDCRVSCITVEMPTRTGKGQLGTVARYSTLYDRKNIIRHTVRATSRDVIASSDHIVQYLRIGPPPPPSTHSRSSLAFQSVSTVCWQSRREHHVSKSHLLPSSAIARDHC